LPPAAEEKPQTEEEPTPAQAPQLLRPGQKKKLTQEEELAEQERKLKEQQEEWRYLVEVLFLNRRRLLRLPGIIAVDVGYKIKAGSFFDALALRLHVERKPHESCFTGNRADERLIDDEESKLQLLVKLDGKTQLVDLKDAKITLDVIEADYRPAAPPPRPGTAVEVPVDQKLINRQRRIDPLVGGISIGSDQASFGTLGALVWDTTDGSVCILSNWHVLAGHSHAEFGAPCFQPGTFDRGRPSDVVARLKRWSFDSQTDAAIAELTGNRHYCAGEILGLPLPVAGTANPYLGMRLLKSGRSTGSNGGFIDGLYFSSAIEYNSGVVQIFENQIHIAPLDPKERISEPGDSGAVWVSEDTGEAVGLHFAGDLLRSAFGEYALANPMTLVADRLKISFRPVFLEIRDDDVVSLPLTSRIELENGGRRSNRTGESAASGHEVGDPIRIPPGGE
jgi:hypothetical protein